jgi:hypothetical protein
MRYGCTALRDMAKALSLQLSPSIFTTWADLGPSFSLTGTIPLIVIQTLSFACLIITSLHSMLGSNLPFVLWLRVTESSTPQTIR